jgi:hypothetical protein
VFSPWKWCKTLRSVMLCVRRSPKLSLPCSPQHLFSQMRLQYFPPAERYYFSPFGWLDPSWYSANIICPIIYHATAGECIISPDFIRASSPLHNNSLTFFSLFYISHPHIFLLGTARTHTLTPALWRSLFLFTFCFPRVQCVCRRKKEEKGKFIP